MFKLTSSELPVGSSRLGCASPIVACQFSCGPFAEQGAWTSTQRPPPCWRSSVYTVASQILISYPSFRRYAHHCPGSLLCGYVVAQCALVQCLDFCALIWGSIQSFSCFFFSMAVHWRVLCFTAFMVRYGYLGFHVQGHRSLALRIHAVCASL